MTQRAHTCKPQNRRKRKAPPPCLSAPFCGVKPAAKAQYLKDDTNNSQNLRKRKHCLHACQYHTNGAQPTAKAPNTN
eukprot:833442-Pelagomonas_calceolata.AAC.4